MSTGVDAASLSSSFECRTTTQLERRICYSMNWSCITLHPLNYCQLLHQSLLKWPATTLQPFSNAISRALGHSISLLYLIGNISHSLQKQHGKKGNWKKGKWKNGNGRNSNRKIGQREKLATKNKRVGKQGNTKLVSRRDGNSCLGNWKIGNGKNWHLFTSCCHTDDAAADLCYMGLPEKWKPHIIKDYTVSQKNKTPNSCP